MGDVGDYWREAREFRKWGPGYRRKVKSLPKIKNFACPVCGKKFEAQGNVESHINSKRVAGDKEHRDHLRRLKGQETPSYRIAGSDEDDDDFLPF